MTSHALHSVCAILHSSRRATASGLAHHEAEALVSKAHIVCPYSNATRGNLALRLVLVSSYA
jgi:lipoyl-dependent peroxiredoxin